MRVTLYKFHKAYFGDFEKGSVHYARAIGDTVKVITEAFHHRSYSPIYEYMDYKYARELSKIFLNNFIYFISEISKNPLNELSFSHNKFVFPKNHTRKRLDVTFSYCYNQKTNSLIFFEFGDVSVSSNWLPIFKTLHNTKHCDIAIPKIEFVTCLDLTPKKTTKEYLFKELKNADFEIILRTSELIRQRQS